MLPRIHVSAVSRFVLESGFRRVWNSRILEIGTSYKLANLGKELPSGQTIKTTNGKSHLFNIFVG